MPLDVRLRDAEEADLRSIAIANEATSGAFGDLIDLVVADPALDLIVQVGPVDVNGAALDVLLVHGDALLEHRELRVGPTGTLPPGVLAGVLRLRCVTVLAGIERWRARRATGVVKAER